MKKFKKDTILNILFPRRCPVCGEIVRPTGRLICPACFRELSFVKSPTCKKCGKEIEDETMEFCADCMAHRHTYEYGLALFNYNDAARNSMVQIKYHNKREYLDFYGAALAVRYEREIRRMRVDAIIPVPVHPSRRRKRGFNQAEVLAKIVGERLGIPVKAELLRRTKKTLPQKELSVGERLKNLSGAFRADEIPENIRRVLLVDDIYTTGSTIEACTRVLKAAGVETIYFVVICMAGGR
ncbi:MAG: ComF family protein [Lachnospiraceae bacterium]|nr:ComF family protein [Lachnospiraceae bacterium]